MFREFGRKIPPELNMGRVTYRTLLFGRSWCRFSSQCKVQFLTCMDFFWVKVSVGLQNGFSTGSTNVPKHHPTTFVQEELRLWSKKYFRALNSGYFALVACPSCGLA